MKRVAGKVAIVTGAASGLGEAIAVLLAEQGARVAVADVDENLGAQVVDKIIAKGCDAIYVPLDVTQEFAWRQAIDRVMAHFGKLNVLVNNAGIAPFGSLDMSFELWRKVISINLDGTFLGTKYAVPAMALSGEPGSIVNISSIMAMVGNASTVAYSASKGGIRSLTKAAAMYCMERKFPIRVNSVHPGMCMTPLVGKFYEPQPEALQAQIAKYPIGHLGEPTDIAYGVLYLASDESKFVLGSELVIDGGFLATD
jgi:NAD(P)-dependent dehydrogenase (short-subunit alcohol dehydrogenase family)